MRGRAWATHWDYQNHWTDAPEKSLEQARRLADEAIVRDDKDPFAHFVAAVVATWTKDYEQWSREADRTLALSPNYALAHITKGNLHTSPLRVGAKSGQV